MTDIEEDRNRLRSALMNLIHLKMIKDLDGKTEQYLKQQPLAWKEAQQAVNKSLFLSN